MAKLTAADRKALPKGDFAIPGRFPIPDKIHAQAALRDIPLAKGLKPGQAATIRRKAEAKLGEKPDREGAGDNDRPIMFGRLGG